MSASTPAAAPAAATASAVAAAAHATRLAAALALAFAALAGPAGAGAPLSAIDWLSDSVRLPPAQPGPASASPAPVPAPVTVAPLGRPAADATGLLTPVEAGLPRSLWSASASADLVRAVAEVPGELPPAMQRLLRALLLAEADAPRGSDGSLFLARVDKLLALGLIEPAGALLLKAGVEDPLLFRRWFDVTLLQGTEDRACRSLQARPQIAPTYPARIFCLARGGDWNAAALTLETGEALGLLSPEEDALMAQFLELELPDGVPEPLPRPSPLVFRIREAIGAPLATGSLPLAFAHADLRPQIGWRARIEAGERLARAGAIEPQRLLAIYAERAPAASGPLWERVGAVQALLEAVAGGRPAAVAAALPPAWEAAREAGLAAPFAQGFAGSLPELPPESEAAAIARTLALLAGEAAWATGPGPTQAAPDGSSGSGAPAAAAPPVPPPGAPPDARPGAPSIAPPGASAAPPVAPPFSPAAMPPDRRNRGREPTPLGAAIADGFAAEGAPERLRPLLDEGRRGEAALAAIALFAEGAEGELAALTEALATLRALGLETVARQAATELLVLDRERP